MLPQRRPRRDFLAAAAIAPAAALAARDALAGASDPRRDAPRGDGSTGRTEPMKLLTERERQTPVVAEVDVLVAGGGPAGIGAALSAARAGARTMLVERYGSLGGMWTTGLLNPLFDHANKGGIVRELVRALQARNAWRDDPLHPGFLTTFDPEAMKFLLDELAGQAGVELLLHTWVADTLLDGPNIQGVLVENKSGRAAILAKVVVDCTGDGDVAARAGAAFEKGRPEDGLMQPLTLMFRLSNCHFLQKNSGHLYGLMQQAAKEQGTQVPPFCRPWIINLPGSGDAVVQLVHVYEVDATDARQLSAACVAARREARQVAELFRHIPELRDARLVATAEQIGVRETRRVLGEYVVTLDDMVAGRRHPDGICLASFNVDIHPLRPADRDHARRPAIKPYHIPYRSLVPRRLERLLVAGRCISGTHEAHASYRVTGDCVAMGEAAGLAAAWCATAGLTPRAIDGAKLRQALKTRGSIVDR
ncbi:MAG TPA: FAD-dependent oxidoreductase [Planctomycetota bacterium]|nr:FAD-dependent oxidoreductase [Planctomycetota bacterium]